MGNMDPLTALSVAGTVVQFVDFGTKILMKTRQIISSAAGATTVNAELELLTQDLVKLIVKLGRPLRKSDARGGESEDEQALENLCDECRKVANELLHHLNGLKVTKKKANGKGPVWESLAKALKSAWTADEVESLMRRLSMFRQSIDTHILASIRFVSVTIFVTIQEQMLILVSSEETLIS
jgi:hypothetical protein